MRRSIFIIVISGILFSCSKAKESYTFTVVVVDWDAATPVSGMKVFSGVAGGLYTDSVITGADGKASFTYPDDGASHSVVAKKNGYASPYYSYPSIFVAPTDRNGIDTILLAKSSDINITVHRTVAYNPGSDLLVLKVTQFITYNHGVVNPFLMKLDRITYMRFALNPDTVYNFQGAYFAPPYNKAYFDWEVVRNGGTIATGSDSTTFIQFGAKSHTINY